MASNPQHEPTMEEILASIRKIISEDSNEPQDLRANGAEHGAEPDVYELREADIVAEDEPVAAEPDRVVALQPKSETQAAPEESSVTASSDSAPASSGSSEGFFSESARKTMHDTFARLSEPGTVGEAPAPHEPTPAPEGLSVQAVFEHAVRDAMLPAATKFLQNHADSVVERMKPLVRDWMDEHFPAILEGAVRNEVERAIKAAAASRTPRR